MSEIIRYGLVVVIVCVIAVGQILFKQSAIALKAHGSFFQLFLTPSFIAAIVTYGLATLGWIWVLQNLSLSRAYPFFALSFVFVPLLSMFIFKDSLSWQYVAGVALICAGIMVIITEQ